MSGEFIDVRALRLKAESVEGTYETLAAADAMQILNGEAQIQEDPLTREIDKPDGGARPSVQTRRRVTITGGIELAGAATAGNAAPHAALLLNAGHAEVLDAGPPAGAEYSPVLKGFASASAEFFWDGERYRAKSGRSRLTSIAAEINNYLRAEFEYMGLIESIAEAAVPSDDVSAFQAPQPLTVESMLASVGGTALEVVSINIDPGIDLNMSYHSEGVIVGHTARSVTGTLRCHRPLVATKDLRTLASTRATEALFLGLSTGTAAEAVEITSATTEFGEPQNVEIDGGYKGWDVPFRMLDDYTLRFGPSL